MNLGLLFTFKYFNFFQGAITDVLGFIDLEYQPRVSDLLLPVGISFYTFQTLSYSIDVYRQNTKVERHFGKFALFVAFFPQLVAGPIERASHLLTQFNQKSLKLKASNITDGALLFLWGLFKKAVVADNLKIIADHIFDNSEFHSGGSILIALFAFTVQIYADFSGYSDMAIGSAKMFGIDLNINFRTPYFSQSITEFWRRWHITLSFWLRDYVFIPLGGSRKGKLKTYRNLFITFFIAGIWHGAAWTFVLWGCLHGVLVVIERVTGWSKSAKSPIIRTLKIILNFSVIVLTMLPVRSDNIPHLEQLIYKLSTITFYDTYIAISQYIFMPGALGLIVLFFMDLLVAQKSILGIKKNHWSLQSVWASIILILILFLGDHQATAFFYFQF